MKRKEKDSGRKTKQNNNRKNVIEQHNLVNNQVNGIVKLEAKNGKHDDGVRHLRLAFAILHHHGGTRRNHKNLCFDKNTGVPENLYPSNSVDSLPSRARDLTSLLNGYLSEPIWDR